MMKQTMMKQSNGVQINYHNYNRESQSKSPMKVELLDEPINNKEKIPIKKFEVQI